MTIDEFQYRRRGYLHFDLPLSKMAAWDLASDPVKVASHSFYPLIGFTVTTLRYQRNDQGKKTREKKERDIKVCSHRDTAIYSLYGQTLAQGYEKKLTELGLQKCVTAFRSTGLSGTNIDHAAEVFEYIRGHRPCVALAFDVSKFFDRLDHNRLKRAWAQIMGVDRLPADHFAVFKSLTRFCWADKEKVYKALGISAHNERHQNSGQERQRLCSAQQFRSLIKAGELLELNPEMPQARGIPQGSPMSAILSNIYMMEFDRALAAKAEELGGLYRRYCDDIIFIVPIEQRPSAYQAVVEQARRAMVDLHPGKFNAVNFPQEPDALADDVLQYLGFTFDGKRTLLRLSSIDRYYSKMRRGVSLARQTQRKANRQEEAAGLPLSGLRRRQLFIRYSYLHARRRPHDPRREAKTVGNFLTYAYRAAEKLQSPHIKRQMRSHWRKLNDEMHLPIKNQLRGP